MADSSSGAWNIQNEQVYNVVPKRKDASKDHYSLVLSKKKIKIQHEERPASQKWDNSELQWLKDKMLNP